MLAMRLLIAALVVTLAIAVPASVFAIWPVVADAPWESEVAVAESTDTLRCQGALDYRVAVVANPPTRGHSGPGTLSLGSPPLPVVAVTDQAALQRLLDQAEREIARYC